MMAGRTPLCRWCNAPTVQGNTFCSVEHENLFAEREREHMQQLQDAGFTHVQGNMFHKDGVAVTTDFIRKIGLEQTLELHKQTVASHEAH